MRRINPITESALEELQVLLFEFKSFFSAIITHMIPIYLYTDFLKLCIKDCELIF